MGLLVLAITPIAAAQACSNDVVRNEIVAQPEGAAPDDDATTTADVSVDAAVTLDALSTLDAVCQVKTETLDAGADVDPPCRYTLPCGLADDTAFVVRGCGFYIVGIDDGGDSSLGCVIPEAYGCTNDVYVPPANGSMTFQCLDCLGGGGRRPNGLLAQEPGEARSAEADYFTRMAHAEAASVHAFARMHEELAHFGAPRDLLSAAKRAVADEERHARIMVRRAKALGGRPIAPRVRRQPRRALESIARENAVEGCIRETYGALVLRFQAANAADPTLRRTFAQIAADETRHAALSWELASWAEAKLSSRAQARVASARKRALRDLERTIHARVPHPLDARLGQPDNVRALALLEGLRASLAA